MESIGYKLMGIGEEKVLVMHNWFGDSSSYDAMTPYLDLEKFSYAFMDVRGYGRSQSMTGNYTVEEASQDAIRLVDALGWDEFHLVGHSMSGMIAQKIAVTHAARIKRMVAITPIPACGSPAPKETMTFLEKAALDQDEFAIECVNLLTSRRYTPSFAKKMVHEWRRSSTPEARLGYLQMYCNTDFSESVKGLKTAMLVLFGEHDFEGSEDVMRKTFLNWYPNAELMCCKSSGHYPMQETPVALASIIETFLAKSSQE